MLGYYGTRKSAAGSEGSDRRRELQVSGKAWERIAKTRLSFREQLKYIFKCYLLSGPTPCWIIDLLASNQKS